MTRKLFFNSVEEDQIEKEEVSTFIDDIERRVIKALDQLEDIRGVENLNQVETCLDLLKELATDLY